MVAAQDPASSASIALYNNQIDLVMNIIGINAYHGDASAALVVDGQLVAAVEEERFNRIKHWAGFPSQSIQYCLNVAGLTIDAIDHIAISFNPRANLSKRLKFVASHRPSARAILDRLKRQGKALGLEDQLAEGLGVKRSDILAKFHRIEHHQTHVAAGYLLSPFNESAVLSVDGMGDFTSTMTAHAQGTTWKEFDRVYFPHSIGFLYSTITMFLGFPYYGDEYKVMGLAPYGKPEFANEIRKMIRPKGDTFELNLDYFVHHKTGVKMKWNDGAPIVEPFHSHKLIELLGPMRTKEQEMTPRHDNIAKSLQVVTEEIILHMLNRLHAKTKSDNLCMTGGVAMNSVANGKITSQTPFKNVYIPAGAADNGTSFGAAFYVWNKVLGKPRSFVQDHAYWGCESTDAECAFAITDAGLPFDQLEETKLIDQTTDLMLDGNVVGWFQGRMEFGARALGNRSLIADPRRTDMRDIINLRIKFRERFRPFAPSILEEHASEWFEIDEATPYMEKVFPIRKEKHELIPAVTHVDGSGRLQTVSIKTNPLYHALITRFYEKTGVPIVLNTSLNENEPVVRTPAEAISCFLRTDMDVLVLGNCLINRHRTDFPAKHAKRACSAP
ncbi:Decarbamoylnovobiocin carbamoyltransferase [Rosistilla oblonga]|uniref:Decarbamoylnovobiocin carbamoyltransferase n=2 Tax=Rosistilla oblonga TaxID=2527990 RepID=A0A518J1W8_9BACT|nr:Decarbamoylnovobiocin carbamoyltransferase [Rosistilla oblonga]